MQEVLLASPPLPSELQISLLVLALLRLRLRTSMKSQSGFDRVCVRTVSRGRPPVKGKSFLWHRVAVSERALPKSTVRPRGRGSIESGKVLSNVISFALSANGIRSAYSGPAAEAAAR